jgi:hypothetical protein
MRTLNFQERFFKNQNEWHYFLSQCGIKEEEYFMIDEINIEVMNSDIEVTKFES